MTSSTTTQPIWSDSETMRAIEWHGTKSMVLNSKHPKPMLTDSNDAIVKITAFTICGSDLHLYHKTVTGMERGDILGHEAVGIVESVGSSVKSLRPGQRVVVSAIIADGTCSFCKEGRTSLCDGTNPSQDMRHMYGGYATAGIFGYSRLTGGYPGTQSEYVRVPHATFNCLPITSNTTELSDEQALLLSDVCCTAWHGNELANVQRGDAVAVWGAGPVGLCAAYLASYRGASKIVIVDDIPERLQMAKKNIPNCDVINFAVAGSSLQQEIHSKFASSGGPNKSIDCVGFRYPKTWKHSIESSLMLETDATDIANEAILYTKKGGSIALIGDYFGYGNHFAIGPLMEKSLGLRGGQVFVQSYWKDLLSLMIQKKIRPEFIYTHQISLEAVPEAYGMFDHKEDGMVKVIVKTGVSTV